MVVPCGVFLPLPADAVKTVTLCNISWPGTLRMNAGLCAAFGGAFPLPGDLVSWNAERLKETCGVGECPWVLHLVVPHIETSYPIFVSRLLLSAFSFG